MISLINEKMNLFFFVMAMLAGATNAVFALSKDSDIAFLPDTKAPLNVRRQETRHVPTSLDASEHDQDLPNDEYMNYLLWPHLHFSGTFQSDVSTVNNIPENYDTEEFVSLNLQRSSHNWNPEGTGEWSVNGAVTQVCYANGTCIDDEDGDKKAEPLFGASVLDGGNMSTAKMVDLDTEAQLFSEIWGWRIRIGDFFSADFSPVPFQYIWKKLVNYQGGDHGYGAAYQSVLSNIRWIENQVNSTFIKQLREIMNNSNIESSKLSIRFNVDMYENDHTAENFTTGRITGTIGLIGKKSPPFFTHGRMMRPLTSLTQSAPFYVDKNRVFVDFGNSIAIDEYGAMGTLLTNDLVVAIHYGNDSKICSPDLIQLGFIKNKSPNWYRNTAGVQVFFVPKPISSINTAEELAKHPLVVAELQDKNCKKILLAEAQDGVDVHPYSNWTFRKNPEETASVQLLVTKFGRPLSNVNVTIDPCNCTNIFSDGPAVGRPPLPLQHTKSVTDKNGIATFDIVAKDPQNSRNFIDGQLYPFIYSVRDDPGQSCDNMCDQDPFMLLNSLFVILVWDLFKQKGEEPTWLDDIYPIFKQYANLYPVMTYNFIDLGNYYEVVKYKNAIKSSMMLPRSHPNHMPVTRDLSESKLNVTLKWLSQQNPAIGNPKNYYSVTQLRKDLQTALQLEHSTIPPYLTALASIKFSYNLEVQNILETVVVQEMMHMALVANILNAVGGKPSLHSKEFLPRYPSRLPGGVQPDLIVPIEKLSLGLIRNIFMKIEQPAATLEQVSSFKHTFDYVQKRKKEMIKKKEGHCIKTEKGEVCTEASKINMVTEHVVDPIVDQDLFPCMISPPENKPLEDSNNKVKKLNPESDHYSQEEKFHQYESHQPDWAKKRRHFPRNDRVIVKNNNTIGGFYIHILNALGNLTNCGRNNSIFTGDPSRQVNVKHWSVHGHSLEVYDYFSAVEAIQLIMEQGEGSSPCNPVAWNEENEKSLSHYFLFHSVAERREIKVFNKTKNHILHMDGDDQLVLDYNEVCNSTYRFTGPKIPFDPNGVWPIIPNARMSKYELNSKAYMQAVKFNKVYTKLLKSLENMFNGHPQTLKDAFGLMYSVDLHLKKLVHTPIDDAGDPDLGPNAGPTFDFTP